MLTNCIISFEQLGPDKNGKKNVYFSVEKKKDALFELWSYLFSQIQSQRMLHMS